MEAMMKKTFAFSFILILALGLLAGCGFGPRTIALDQNANGQTVTMKTGETLKVSLRSDPINGYAWQVEKIDPQYLEASPDMQYTPVGNDPVAGGTQVLTFNALKAGTTQLGLSYQRSSGEGVSLPKTFTITVEIQ
jgi:inhibitor of cysteine peptidase